MSKVFEDKACAQFLLQIILNRKDLNVQKVHAQHDVKNLQGRFIRLDIIAIDGSGRVYNIEIQRSDKGASIIWTSPKTPTQPIHYNGLGRSFSISFFNILWIALNEFHDLQMRLLLIWGKSMEYKVVVTADAEED